MKKLKITERLIEQMAELCNSRNNIEHYNFNFLTNISRYLTLIHKLIEIRLEANLFDVAVSQYFVSLVSCWETYFRDTFTFIASKDEAFRIEISNLIGIKRDVVESLYHDNLLGEFLSKSFNFQNFDDIENSFSPIFNRQMFATISNYVFPYLGLNGQITTDFCFETICPNSLESIKRVYEERHKITHDANYRPSLENEFVQKVEASFVVFPQLFTI
jgi:hypothetical protein